MQLILTELLSLQEGEQLDFKQRITSLEKIAKTICAFANTRGGLLLIGVKDDRSISGIDPEEEKFMLEQAATAYCLPPIALHYQELEDEEEHFVLAVTIAESSQKPHRCRNRQGHWQVYVRLADQSLPAGLQLIRRLERGLETAPMPDAALSPYDKSILDYIRLHQRITLKQLMLLLNFSKRRAQRQLQDMLNKGLLRHYEHEQEDFWA